VAEVVRSTRTQPLAADGVTGAVTTIAPMRRVWMPWLRVVFWIGRRTTILARPLFALATISVGRWTILRLGRRRYLMFETNFNDMWHPYIDDFARVMHVQWRGIWGGAYDFPGALPSEGLLHYIERVDIPAEHYYCAYREATNKMILSALELEPEFSRFATAARQMEPAAFEVAWRAFVTEHQLHL
jgi:hypothetical protein